MNYIYNANNFLYYNLAQYLASIAGTPTGTRYQVMLMYSIADLWDKVKQRTSRRGRLAKDSKTGVSLLDSYAMTDDELDMFITSLRKGSAELFHNMSGFAKLIDDPYRFNVKFGDPLISGVITLVNGLILSVNTGTFANDVLIGYKIVITSPGVLANQERTITDNASGLVTINSVFDSDPTGLTYAIMAQTKDYVIMSLWLDTNYDMNMLQGVDASLEDALITYCIKEWYLINRFMDDWQIEDKMYNDAVSNMRMQLFQGIKTYKATQFFNSDDTIEDE